MKILYLVRVFMLQFLLIISISTFSFSQVIQPYEPEVAFLANKISEQATVSKFSSIAVMDFVDVNGQVSALGRFLAEEISIALVSQPRSYKVVDRTHLRTIMAEHKLSYQGVVDDRKYAQKLGKIAGVEALVIGTITPLGNQLRITMKLMDTETAHVVGGAKASLRLGDPMAKLARTELSTSISEKYEDTSTKTIEIEPATFDGRNSSIKIEKIEVDTLGKLKGHFVITTRKNSCYFALFRPANTAFLSDENGERYLALGCDGIKTVERDKINRIGNESKWSRFPKGIPTKFLIIFPPLRSRPKALYFSCILNGFQEKNEFQRSGRNISIEITNIKVK